MFIWMLASWFVAMMPQAGGGRFIHFLESIVAPVIDPIRKRIPSTSMGMINIGYTVAFIFVWWSLQVLAYRDPSGITRWLVGSAPQMSPQVCVRMARA